MNSQEVKEEIKKADAHYHDEEKRFIPHFKTIYILEVIRNGEPSKRRNIAYEYYKDAQANVEEWLRDYPEDIVNIQTMPLLNWHCPHCGHYALLIRAGDKPNDPPYYKCPECNSIIRK